LNFLQQSIRKWKRINVIIQIVGKFITGKKWIVISLELNLIELGYQRRYFNLI